MGSSSPIFGLKMKKHQNHQLEQTLYPFSLQKNGTVSSFLSFQNKHSPHSPPQKKGQIVREYMLELPPRPVRVTARKCPVLVKESGNPKKKHLSFVTATGGGLDG